MSLPIRARVPIKVITDRYLALHEEVAVGGMAVPERTVDPTAAIPPQVRFKIYVSRPIGTSDLAVELTEKDWDGDPLPNGRRFVLYLGTRDLINAVTEAFEERVRATGSVDGFLKSVTEEEEIPDAKG